MSTEFPYSLDGNPFLHPLSQRWVETHTDIIYAEKTTEGIEIFVEYNVRGDPVEYVATKLNKLLSDEEYEPEVWGLQLSSIPGNSCTVFAPKHFAIKDFYHDLALLSAMGEMDKFLNKATLGRWAVPGCMLTNNMSYSKAVGWWHEGTEANVIVASHFGEQRGAGCLLAQSIAEKIWRKGEKRPEVQLMYDNTLIDDVFKKSTGYALEEIRKYPHKPKP